MNVIDTHNIILHHMLFYLAMSHLVVFKLFETHHTYGMGDAGGKKSNQSDILEEFIRKI